MCVNRKVPKFIHSFAVNLKFKNISVRFASRSAQDIVHLLQDRDRKSTVSCSDLLSKNNVVKVQVR